MERSIGNELEDSKENQGYDPRVDITIRSYRRHNHDTEGVSAKAAIDGLVAQGILPTDSQSKIRKVTFESIVGEEEKTVIEIKEIKAYYKQAAKELE